jgi:hypothetical protein
VTYNNSAIIGDIGLLSEAAASGQPVTFNGGTILQHNRFSGIPPAGIWVNGPGNLTFIGVTIGREVAAWLPTGSAWLAEKGAHLSFIGSTVAPPLGTNDPLSTVVGP